MTSVGDGDLAAFAEELTEGRPGYPDHLVRLYYALQDAPVPLFQAVNAALEERSGQWPGRDAAKAALRHYVEWLNAGLAALDDAG